MSDKIPGEYTGKYTSWKREDILAEVKTKIKPSRYEHVLRVEESAVELARRYGADPEACSLAALLHDYAKDLERETMETIIRREDWDPALLTYGSEIWHGPAGAYFAERQFGVEDPAILSAIRQHTVGSQEMTLVSKVLFVADYIEAGRKFPGVEEARRLAQESLEQAAFYKIKQTLIHLTQREAVIYPETLTVYNSWVSKREEIEREK